MSNEIIIGQKNEKEEEKKDRVHEMVSSLAKSLEILGEDVTIKNIFNGDGNILRIFKNGKREFLEVRYGSSLLQMNVKFTLYKGEDDALINTMKELAEIDKDDWDRFFIEEENNAYGAILIGLDQFEEMFPKMR